MPPPKKIGKEFDQQQQQQKNAGVITDVIRQRQEREANDRRKAVATQKEIERRTNLVPIGFLEPLRTIASLIASTSRWWNGAASSTDRYDESDSDDLDEASREELIEQPLFEWEQEWLETEGAAQKAFVQQQIEQQKLADQWVERREIMETGGSARTKEDDENKEEEDEGEDEEGEDDGEGDDEESSSSSSSSNSTAAEEYSKSERAMDQLEFPKQCDLFRLSQVYQFGACVHRSRATMSNRTCIYTAIRRTDSRPVVLKIVGVSRSKCPIQPHDIPREIRYYATCQRFLDASGVADRTVGNHLLTVHGYHPLPETNCFAIVMDVGTSICLGRSADASLALQQRSNEELFLSRDLELTRTAMFQLLGVVAFLHETCSIIHRDIKLDNLMWDSSERRLRLFDLDCAIRQRLVTSSSGRIRPRKFVHYNVGTSGYRAPEIDAIADEDGIAAAYDHSIDIYSCGVVFGQLLFGVRTKDIDRHSRLNSGDGFRRRARFLIQRTPVVETPPELALLLSMLEHDASARPTARAALEHPFFASMKKL